MVWYGPLVRHGIIGEKQGTTTTMGKRNETHPKSRRRDFVLTKELDGACGVSRLVYQREEEEEAQLNSNGRRSTQSTYRYYLSAALSPFLSLFLPDNRTHSTAMYSPASER